MGYMTPQQWAAFRNVMNKWQDDVFQQEIIWRRLITINDPHGEDKNQRSQDIPLKGLVHYNHFRSWPLTLYTEAGEQDKQNCMVFFNIEYLKSLGYAQEGHLEFNQALDKFIINGIEYDTAGDSQVSQAHHEPLFIFIVLKRASIETGTPRYG